MKQRAFPLSLAIFIYFTFLGGTLYTLTNFSLKVFNHIAVTLILGFWLWRRMVWLWGQTGRATPLPRTPLDWPVAFWLGVQVLSAIFSLHPRFSFESLWQPLSHAIAFYLLLDLIPKQGRALVRATYLSGAVVCLIGLLEFASWYFGLPLLPQFAQGWSEIGGWANPIPPYWYRLNFTLNGATSLSAYLALLIPPALAIWLTSKKKEDRQALAGWLILGVVVEILTFSRGGILALGVSLPLFFLVWITLQSSRFPVVAPLRRSSRIAILSGIGLVLIVSLAGLGFFQGRIASHGSGDQVRLNLWQSAISMAADYPLLGVGPKLYGLALRTYRDPAFARDQITTAHNLYLNTAAETGLLGLLGGGWLIGALALAGWRNWQATGSPNRRLRLAGIAASLAGFGAQNLVDTFNATQIILPVMLGAAYLITPHQVSKTNGTPIHLKWRPYAMLGLIVVYALVLGKWDLAQSHFQRAARLAQQDDFKAALAEADQAVALDPQLILYQFEVAYYQSHLADSDPVYLTRAIETYRTAQQRENSNPNYQANLAGLLWQAGDPEGAIAALETALTLVPDSPLLLLHLGYFYELQGNRGQALAHYAGAITRLPTLLDTGFWTPETRRQIIDTVYQQTQDLPLVSQLTLTHGDLAEAEILARQAIKAHPQQVEGYLVLIRTLLAQRQPDTALAILADQFPQFGTLAAGELYRLRAQARWMQKSAAPEAISQDLKTALFISPFANAQAYDTLGQIYEAQGDLERAKLAYSKAIPPQFISQNYDVVVYGRGTNHPPLVPQLIYFGQGESHANSWLRLLALYEAEEDVEQAAQVKKSLQTRYPYLSLPDK